MKKFAKFLRGLFRRWRRPLTFDVATMSEKGPVRQDNQDHFMYCEERALFCVADGMGGGDGGAEASEIVCNRMNGWVGRRSAFNDRVRDAYNAVLMANMDILEYAHRAHYERMATTVAFLMVDKGQDRQGVVGYVGDSRVYRLRRGRLEALTQDHTIAGELIRNPSMRDSIDKMGLRDGQLSHVLTRAVGIEFYIEVDWRNFEVRPGDTYLLCTDGVYDMVDDAGLREVLSSGKTSAEIVAELEKRIMAGGAVDNYTMIVVRVAEAPSR